MAATATSGIVATTKMTASRLSIHCAVEREHKQERPACSYSVREDLSLLQQRGRWLDARPAEDRVGDKHQKAEAVTVKVALRTCSVHNSMGRSL